MKKLLCMMLLATSFYSYSQTTKKPNIIIILADDLGWGDVGFHGSDIKTPNIDGFAKSGVELKRYYTAPICSPTRAGLMTGRYPNRLGIRDATIPPWSEFGVDTSEVFMPQMLAQAGYKNRAIIGKWHLGHATLQYHPMRRGFTHFYGFLNGALDYFTHEREGQPDWQNDYETSKDKGYTTELLTAEAVKCVKNYSKDKEPFFMYVAYNSPHGPLQAPEKYLKMYGYDPSKPKFADGGGEEGEASGLGKGNTIKQTYSAMVTCMDDGIGQILKALKDQGIDDNTLVIFHSDNGAAGSGKTGSHGELRGYKFDEWEGGVRSPAVIRWPAVDLKGGKSIDQVMGFVDLFPTFKDIVGLKTPFKNPVDGMSMWPVLSGKQPKFNRDFYLGHGAMLSGDWKLILDKGIKKMGMNGDVLFHLPPDYSETTDVKAANTATYEKLKAAVEPYDALKAKKELLGKGPKGKFKAPVNWKITREQ